MNEKTDLSALRQNYSKNELSESNVANNPIEQFEIWFQEALKAEIREPNAMCLSTLNEEKPSSRIVLLKGIDEGFVFFTNYESNKGNQIAKSQFASLNFFWVDLERQIRIEGIIEKVSEKESDEYFYSRPRGSQVGAWVSNQSKVVENRTILEAKLLDFEKEYENKPIPRPPHWGGYRLIPDKIEFWQGRPNRLHDRILYSKNDNNWKIERLCP
jgi:pyridoxamine 5'-phosphate oxidase